MPDKYHYEVPATLPREAIFKALSENYESLYAVDIETSAYRCFHESDSFSSLQIERSGEDFFATAGKNIAKAIYADDQEYVRRMMSKEELLAGVEKEKYYSFIYRLMIDGKPLYHKLRASKGRIDQRPYLLIGVRNIDSSYRLDKAHADELSSLHSKEINHLDAILASAEGYIEANLSKDLVLEVSPYTLPEGIPEDAVFPTTGESLSYSDLRRRLLAYLARKNQEKYMKISDREYLIRCYERGEKRASVSFSAAAAGGQLTPCKEVFYLYRDNVTGDILSFCVLYDLTEQQRKEKELRDLERELQMSRIRNFTSQMQPHFLYNTLASIQEIVLVDPKYASELIGDFTVHLRSCIRAMANDAPIPFQQELANIQAYANIEKMRFGDKLHVVFDVKAQDFSILPLSVQPLVENAIRHGIYERGAAGGTVTVRTAERDDAWLVAVEDDGVGFDVASMLTEQAYAERGSTGLKNIMFRLDKIMGASVDIRSVVGSGTAVTITVPKRVKENESNHRG